MDIRAVVNAIFYLLRTGCQWRLLPKGFPPWGKVWWYFRRWHREGVWVRIHRTLHPLVRAKAGRRPGPQPGDGEVLAPDLPAEAKPLVGVARLEEGVPAGQMEAAAAPRGVDQDVGADEQGGSAPVSA